MMMLVRCVCFTAGCLPAPIVAGGSSFEWVGGQLLLLRWWRVRLAVVKVVAMLIIHEVLMMFWCLITCWLLEGCGHVTQQRRLLRPARMGTGAVAAMTTAVTVRWLQLPLLMCRRR